MTTPQQTVSDVVGARIREVRRRRDLTAAQLAERCKAHGAPQITKTVVQDIESGRPVDGRRRRHVTVDELLVLGLALNVAPVHLLVPIDGDTEPYPVLSPAGNTCERWRVRGWIRGPYFGSGLPWPLPTAKDSREYQSEAPAGEFRMAKEREGTAQ